MQCEGAVRTQHKHNGANKSISVHFDQLSEGHKYNSIDSSILLDRLLVLHRYFYRMLLCAGTMTPLFRKFFRANHIPVEEPLGQPPPPRSQFTTDKI